MNITFEINGKYTLVSISGMAITIRAEIVITGLHEVSLRYIFKHRGRKKEFYLPKEEDLQRILVFKGHGLPFTVDSETERFTGNAQFNFVTDKPEELKLFIEKNCLNASPSKFAKVFYTGLDRNTVDMPESFPLFQ